MTELEQLDYDDALLGWFTACTQYGVRKILEDFRFSFPDIYDEMVIQINRGNDERKIPILLLR